MKQFLDAEGARYLVQKVREIIANKTLAFSEIEDKPTTIAGYGIVDALAADDLENYVQANDLNEYATIAQLEAAIKALTPATYEATTQEDVVEEQVEAAPERVSGESVYVANKIDTGVSKAILVTDDQYKKLEASIDSQIALCKFRNILVGKEVVEDKDDLESLMEKANQLYQDGNIEEAEKLYNKISELSKNGTA